MTYADYPEYYQPFVIMHMTGNGVMEDPFTDIGIVAQAGTKEEADYLCDKFRNENNLERDIKTSWYKNHYTVNINTFTLEGIRLKEEFNKLWEDRITYAKDHPEDYITYKINGYTFHMQKHGGLNDLNNENKNS